MKTLSDSPILVTYLNAGCLLINKPAFLQVGGFDERNFLYVEEPDLFLKFKLFGFKSHLHSGVEVIHLWDQRINLLPLHKYLLVRINAFRNIMFSLVRGNSRILAKWIGSWNGRGAFAKKIFG